MESWETVVVELVVLLPFLWIEVEPPLEEELCLFPVIPLLVLFLVPLTAGTSSAPVEELYERPERHSEFALVGQALNWVWIVFEPSDCYCQLTW